MRLIPIALGLLLAACGGSAKKDDSQAAKKTDETDEAEKKSGPEDEKSASDEAATDETERTASAGFDCGAVVTSADVQKACGVQTQGEISPAEGRTPLAACSRKFRGPDQKSISFQFAVHPSVEKVSTIAWPEDAKSITDLGDAASAYVADKGGQFDWHTVEVRAGAQIFYLRSINGKGVDPLCTTDQLTDLARETFPRTQKP